MYALLMDLADMGGNVKDGCHIASLGGSWMATIYGFAGMRDRGGQLSFDPRPYLDRLRFALTIRGQRLEVHIDNGVITYLLRGEEGLTIKHRGESVALRDGQPVSRDLGKGPKGEAAPQDSNQARVALLAPTDQKTP
jgi:alpha,alpha-trehalose phosphorylase